MKKIYYVAVAIAALLRTVPSFAVEPFKLKDGPGMNVVENACSGCHSLDYIFINCPFMDKAKWKASVAKMKTVFNATIDDQDVPTIVDYLATQYGQPK